MLIVRADVLDDFAEVSRAGDYFRTMELGIVEISPAAPIRSSTTISLASRSGGQPHVHSCQGLRLQAPPGRLKKIAGLVNRPATARPRERQRAGTADPAGPTVVHCLLEVVAGG